MRRRLEELSTFESDDIFWVYILGVKHDEFTISFGHLDPVANDAVKVALDTISSEFHWVRFPFVRVTGTPTKDAAEQHSASAIFILAILVRLGDAFREVRTPTIERSCRATSQPHLEIVSANVQRCSVSRPMKEVPFVDVRIQNVSAGQLLPLHGGSHVRKLWVGLFSVCQAVLQFGLPNGILPPQLAVLISLHPQNLEIPGNHPTSVVVPATVSSGYV
mmetsp:Transcript_43512/g.114820  ORF Transcript_43512/g.114820 Transcript_43512/m.114820 type:complete len:219 (-) Transcript_43512:887-1543(-)